MKEFDPMNDVPETDEEVMVALKRPDEILTVALQGIYRARRAQGDSLIEAYEKALLAHVEAFQKQEALS